MPPISQLSSRPIRAARARPRSAPAESPTERALTPHKSSSIAIVLGLGLSFLAGSGCVAPMADGTEESDQDEALQEADADSVNKSWFTQLDCRYNIPVCFMDDDGDSQSARTIKNKVTAEYGRAGITFSGWRRCSSTTPCPAIRATINKPRNTSTTSVGSQDVCSRAPSNSMSLSPTNLWAVVHEFGHALGYTGDVPGCDSAFNYCERDGIHALTSLTPLDIRSLNSRFEGKGQCPSDGSRVVQATSPRRPTGPSSTVTSSNGSKWTVTTTR